MPDSKSLYPIIGRGSVEVCFTVGDGGMGGMTITCRHNLKTSRLKVQFVYKDNND